jgi:CMP-N,N'-diacetyllegionaminic acid synthase
MRVLGVIPARGGSKGVPRKNIRMLAGKPLLAYTIECARAARSLERVILSTEDEEIAEVGRRWGVEVPFLRPVELAQDDTPTLPVIQHAVRFLEERGERFDAVMILQPTSPLRSPEDIDGAVGLMEQTGCDSVIAFVEVGEHHPARMKMVDETLRVSDPPFAEEVEGMPRQMLPRLYLRAGSVYLTRTSVLMKTNRISGDDCRAWIVPPERAVNIDTEFDFVVAEALLKTGRSGGA